MNTYRIVVGGSPTGVRALRWAAHQASVHGGTVQAVMVYDWGRNRGRHAGRTRPGR